VYKITPQGIRKAARYKFIPVKASMVAAPPRSSMDVTMMLAENVKKRNMMWAAFPQWAFTISHIVCAEGATFLSEMVIKEKNLNGCTQSIPEL
jgi:hypothetical protein